MPAEAESFEALSELSFSVSPGEVYAIIGRNGAGKTTLLRVLAGIIPPSRGFVRVSGRIAPLIDLSVGFDPELTGDENLLLYGSLLGISMRRLRILRDPIVEFSGLQSVMDAAVKNYSSGMAARLGFAIATACSPDLLLVDEVLAVGDHAFRVRCMERIAELRASGAAIVLVSHDSELVRRSADRGMLLDAGRAVAVGSADRIVDEYLTAGQP
jgi:ABC-type polysaccharide/polyol phosphate transport system ATPase subunit